MGQQETIQTKRKLEVKPRIDELVTHIYFGINLLVFCYYLVINYVREMKIPIYNLVLTCAMIIKIRN
jgi:hypothetical protein